MTQVAYMVFSRIVVGARIEVCPYEVMINNVDTNILYYMNFINTRISSFLRTFGYYTIIYHRHTVVLTRHSVYIHTLKLIYTVYTAAGLQ